MRLIRSESTTVTPVISSRPAVAHPAVTSVACTNCWLGVPAESFVYWAQQREVVWLFTQCPNCQRPTKWASSSASGSVESAHI